ncbi:TetR/AcrR family transcriptional regulator [Actinoplanes sp. G11-F43]|uniref:TetR/AcrR family transcriptional regulator n=1 Tax=Actinoplanes sp. G11-F43 TaxID=3424130 RepID=UPI003D32616E
MRSRESWPGCCHRQRDLARELGVSHAAPRRHFPDRQHLLDALAEAGYTRLGERIRAAVATGDDGLTDTAVDQFLRGAAP